MTAAIGAILWFAFLWHIAHTKKDQMEMHLLIVWDVLGLSAVIALGSLALTLL